MTIPQVEQIRLNNTFELTHKYFDVLLFSQDLPRMALLTYFKYSAMVFISLPLYVGYIGGWIEEKLKGITGWGWRRGDGWRKVERCFLVCVHLPCFFSF